MNETAPEFAGGTGARFLQTHWSLVLAAGAVGSPHSREALEALCRSYWPPVYAEIRRRGHHPADAQDLTQGFFARLLRGEFFSRASREKGRFRSYLLGALDHFLLDEHSRSTAGRRGGGQRVLSLDAAEAESWHLDKAAKGSTPAEAFDHRWALIMMDRAFAALREDYVTSGRGELFAALQPFLAAECDDGYEAAAQSIGLTARAFTVAVCRFRERFRAGVRRQVTMIVADPAEVEDELRHLCGVR